MRIALLLALIAILLSIAMSAAWIVARKRGRSGWTDVIWSYAVGAAGVGAALVPIDGPPGFRQWLVAALVAGWSLRLGTHIATRIHRGVDDPRYAELREMWGEHFPARLFAFLQIQAAAAWLLTLSVLVAARNPAPAPAWSDMAGATLLIGAVVGEGVADAQLRAFRHRVSNRRRVCDTGLWSLSRHPNYFFEWLGWAAYAVIAIGPDGRFGWMWGWLALSGLGFMYWLLVHVSGIPPLEAHMLRSRGEAFRDTQRRIRAFWPLPRRHAEEHRR
jgi:steroid 5-alpha reductase family enzyme